MDTTIRSNLIDVVAPQKDEVLIDVSEASAEPTHSRSAIEIEIAALKQQIMLLEVKDKLATLNHTQVFNKTQTKVTKVGLMEQRNPMTAMNLLDQHYNRKGKTLEYQATMSGTKHQPTWYVGATITVGNVKYSTRRDYFGHTKKQAQMWAAWDLLVQLRTETDFEKVPKSMWIRDLTEEGIEPEPGPDVPVRISTRINFPGGSALTFPPNVSPGGVTKTRCFYEGSGDLRIVATGSINGIPDRTDWHIPGRVFTDISYLSTTTLLSVSVSAGSGGGTFYMSEVAYSIKNNSVSVSNLPTTQVVSVSNDVNVNIINETLPVSFNGGDLNIGISAESQPIWVTSFGPNAEEPHNTPHSEDLTGDGCVEKNPGPNPFGQAYEPKVYVPQPHGMLSVHSGASDESAMAMLLGSSIHEPQVTENPEEYKTSFRNDHIMLLAKMRGDVGEYFLHTAHCLGLPVSNRYSILDEEMPLDYPAYEEVGKKPKYVQKVERTGEERLPKKKEEPKLEEVEISKRDQRLHVLNRFKVKFGGKNLSMIVGWIRDKKPKRAFCSDVADHVFGENWKEEQDFNQYHLYVYCYIEDINMGTQCVFLMTYDTKYLEYLDISSYEAELQMAKLHNKTMHAYNGNPLSTCMADVDILKEWESALDKPISHFPRYSGIEAQVMISNITGNTNPNQSNIFEQDRLRGNVVEATNNIIENMGTTLPTTNMVPRNWWDPRDGSGVIQGDVYGAKVTEVNIVEYYSSPIQPTDLSVNLSQAVLNGQTTAWRRDNTTLSGFNVFDTSNINTTLLQKGITLEEDLFKLELLHGICSSDTDWPNISASTWSVINPSIIPLKVRPRLEVNTSPVPGETCGGNDPVYPWGGDKGKIAFHLTPESVPNNERASMAYITGVQLQAGYEGPEALSLFTVSKTEWPFCLYNFKQRCVFLIDARISDEEDLSFIPNETWTHVPGLKTIHIIMPKKISAPNPTTYREASATTQVIPRSGPTATVNVVADFEYTINAIGQPLITYDLTDYLYSWALTWDIVSIKNYIGRLGVAMGVRDTMHVCREMRIALCQQTPAMYLQEPQAGSQIPPYPSNGVQEPWLNEMHVRHYPNHTEVREAPVLTGAIKFPIMKATPAVYRIYATNLAVWNKVALGLATAENLRSEGLMAVPAYLGDPRSSYWDRLEAIPMIAVWFVFYFLSGMTTKAWETGYTSLQNKWIQNRVRLCFSTTHTNGTLVPAYYDSLLRKIMEYMYERSPSLAKSFAAGIELEISSFGRWLPALKYAKTYTYADRASNPNDRAIGISAYIPVLLPDIWIQYPAIRVIKSMASFPPPFGLDSLQGYGPIKDKTLVPHRTNQLGLIGPYIERGAIPVYGMNEGPEPKDNVKWNYRIWYINRDHIPGDYTAQRTDEQFPFRENVADLDSLVKPVARNVFSHPGDNPGFGLPVSNTMCFPEISVTGARIVPYLNAAISVVPIGALNRSQRLPVSVWLLNNVYVEPEVQTVNGDGIIRDCFSKYVNPENCLNFLESAAIENTAISPSELATQAVDVVRSSDLANQSTTRVQPSEVVSDLATS